jgi:hypothetical protein
MSGRRQADVIAMGMEACLDTMSAGPKDRRGKGTVFQPWLNVGRHSQIFASTDKKVGSSVTPSYRSNIHMRINQS